MRKGEIHLSRIYDIEQDWFGTEEKKFYKVVLSGLEEMPYAVVDIRNLLVCGFIESLEEIKEGEYICLNKKKVKVTLIVSREEIQKALTKE